MMRFARIMRVPLGSSNSALTCSSHFASTYLLPRLDLIGWRLFARLDEMLAEDTRGIRHAADLSFKFAAADVDADHLASGVEDRCSTRARGLELWIVEKVVKLAFIFQLHCRSMQTLIGWRTTSTRCHPDRLALG